MSRRFALLVGNDSYDDQTLRQMAAPTAELEVLADLLRNESIGDYKVEMLVNASRDAIHTQLARFFQGRKQEDVLLLFFSGHAIRTPERVLCLATVDTDLCRLPGTGLDAPFIAACMDSCEARNQIFILDSCHTRMVTSRAHAVDDRPVGTDLQFEGNGRNRIVLTGTDNYQYLFDGDTVTGDVYQSKYSRRLIEGLNTGKADLDGNGVISVDEIAKYLYDRTVEDGSGQMPRKYIFEAQGGTVFAWNRGRKRSKQLKKCFVISPLSTGPARADAVFDTYIKTACKGAGFRPWRSDMQLSEKILPEVMASLRTDPMVIAYLGAPSWNPNVMIEVGFRLATGKPIVLLREEPKVSNEPPLPFDLQDLRVVYLPDPLVEKGNPKIVADKVKMISSLLKDRGEGPTWDSSHAVATVHIDRKTGAGRFTESSQEADQLFDMEHSLTDVSLKELVASLKERMPIQQFEAFAAEQGDLLAKLTAPPQIIGKDAKAPVATKPIVFHRHNRDDRYINRAYLPIVIHYSRQADELWFKVLYLDVTGATKQETPGKELYVCEFDTGTLPATRPHSRESAIILSSSK